MTVLTASQTRRAARQALVALLANEKIAPVLRARGSVGGYLCVISELGGSITTEQVGIISRGDAAHKDREVAREKAQRLLRQPKHTSSRQSRNPAEEKWAGAIRAGKYLFSFDGFVEEDLNELYVVMIAARLKLLTREEATKLLEANQYIAEQDILNIDD